jgi:hypothetical protein
MTTYNWMHSNFIFRVGPFDVSRDYTNASIETDGLKGCQYVIYYGNTSEAVKIVQSNIEYGKKYFWLNFWGCFFNDSSFIYDNNFHDMEMNLTLKNV